MPALIYDGDCGFCTTSARWIEQRWTRPAHVVPSQQFTDDDLRAIGITRADVDAAVWWLDGRQPPQRGHRAIAHALLAGSGFDRIAGRIILTPPISVLARAAYWLIARNRHRLPGATDACRV